MLMINFRMSVPLCIGSSGSLFGVGLVLSFGGGKCFARDLYIPRCLPDGEVVVASGHFLKPWIIFSWSIGFAVVSFGRVLDFRCRSSDLV